jgi:FkbM family methyltransferase
VEEVALGDQEGVLPIRVHVAHSPSSSFLQVTARGLELYPFQREQAERQVRVARLDDYVREKGITLREEVLVKVDVQGYEDRVIRGGRDTLARAAACIVEVSLEPLYNGQANFRGLLELLEELGFRYAGNLEQAYGPAGQVVFIDAVFLTRRIRL